MTNSIPHRCAIPDLLYAIVGSPPVILCVVRFFGHSAIQSFRPPAISIRLPLAMPVAAALTMNIASALSIYPHTLSYFNEIAGGPRAAPAHILDGNADWGQDLLFLKQWHDSHPQSRPLSLSYVGPFDATIAGLNLSRVPRVLRLDESGNANPVRSPGWYALSLNDLHSYKRAAVGELPYEWLPFSSDFISVGYSIRIYYIPFDCSAPSHLPVN